MHNKKTEKNQLNRTIYVNASEKVNKIQKYLTELHYRISVRYCILS
jgi:hypothetical protein